MTKSYTITPTNHFDYEPIRTTIHTIEAQEPLETHNFSDYAIVYCFGGKGKLSSKYETFFIGGPFCVLIPKFLEFSIENIHNSTLNYLIIEYNINKPSTFDLENSFIHFITLQNKRILEYFNNILDEITNPSEKFNVIIRHLFNLIMIYEGNEMTSTLTESQQTQLSKQINAALYFIDNHFHLKITTEQMAEVAELSPNYFIAMFKRELDETPNQYLTKRRMEHAHWLLEVSGLTVKKIAHECGYLSSSHFSTKFSDFYGYSPKNLKSRLY